MKFLIEFDSVFDADEGIKLINKIRLPDSYLQRSHHFGSLVFDINKSEYYLLKYYKIGFKKL